MFGAGTPAQRGPGLFRLRNMLGGALIIGLITGAYFSDWMPGLGTGGNAAISLNVSPDDTGNNNAEFNVGDDAGKGTGGPLRVVIKDWNYFIRVGKTDTPVELADLVTAVAEAKGDADGIRLRVYRTDSARATAEHKLQDALKAAGVVETAVYFSPEPIE